MMAAYEVGGGSWRGACTLTNHNNDGSFFNGTNSPKIDFVVDHEGLEIDFMLGCEAFANSDMALNVMTAAEIAHRNTNGGQSYCNSQWLVIWYDLSRSRSPICQRDNPTASSFLCRLSKLIFSGKTTDKKLRHNRFEVQPLWFNSKWLPVALWLLGIGWSTNTRVCLSAVMHHLNGSSVVIRRCFLKLGILHRYLGQRGDGVPHVIFQLRSIYSEATSSEPFNEQPVLDVLIIFRMVGCFWITLDHHCWCWLGEQMAFVTTVVSYPNPAPQAMVPHHWEPSSIINPHYEQHGANFTMGQCSWQNITVHNDSQCLLSNTDLS